MFHSRAYDAQWGCNKCPITLQTNLLIEQRKSQRKHRSQVRCFPKKLFAVLIRLRYQNDHIDASAILNVSKCAKVSKFLSEKCCLQQQPNSICSASEQLERKTQDRKIYNFIDSKFRFIVSMRYSKISSLSRFSSLHSFPGKGHIVKMVHRGIIFDLGKQSRI